MIKYELAEDSVKQLTYAMGQTDKSSTKLTPQLVLGIIQEFLLPYYDDPQPIPGFHHDALAVVTSDARKVAIAAPRGHAKTTTLTIGYVIANLICQTADFIVLASNTEKQVIDILDAIKLHIKHNDILKKIFPEMKLVSDTKTEVIGTIDGEWYFKITTRSWTQQFRGLLWAQKRPNLVILDDFESPEDVLNKETREKAMSKLLTDIMFCMSSYGKIRVYGTVLHQDALLESILNDKSWASKRYAAHNADFTKILFPGKFTKEYFITLQETYAANGNLDLYYREMLNRATATGDTLFAKNQFQPMVFSGNEYREAYNKWNTPMRFYVTIDFAISEKQKADFTVFLVFGICAENNIYVVHLERFRASADTPTRIEDTFFDLYDKFHPEVFVAESEKIDKAIMPYIRQAMQRRNKFFRVLQIPSTASKIQRLYSLVPRMQARCVYFNREASWYEVFEHELMQATPAGIKARNDDQADTFGMIGTHIDKYLVGPTTEELEIIEIQEHNNRIDEQMIEDGAISFGASEITGY